MIVAGGLPGRHVARNGAVLGSGTWRFGTAGRADRCGTAVMWASDMCHAETAVALINGGAPLDFFVHRIALETHQPPPTKHEKPREKS